MAWKSQLDHDAHVAAAQWAKVDDSDPWAFARTKLHLSRNISIQGLPSDVKEDAERISKRREETLHFDQAKADALKKHLGLS